MRFFWFPAFFVSLFSLPVLACSCLDQHLPMSDVYAKTDVIFTGKVTRKNTQRLADLNEVEFQLIELLKGPLEGPLVVKTGAHKGSCGYPFEEGKEYLVYVSKTPGVKIADYQTSICSLTKPMKKASEDLQSLRELKKNRQ